MKNKKTMLLLTIILLLAFLIFHACHKPKSPEPIIKEQATEGFKTVDYNNDYKAPQVKENRVIDFITYLNGLGADIQSPTDLLRKASSSQARQQLSKALGIDPFRLLVHIELADLLKSGLSEIDAQMLHFSQWNYLDLFTGGVINSKGLAHADPEKVFMELSGWAAGSLNPIVQQYNISFPEIEAWINAAAKSGDCTIQYSNDDLLKEG